MSWAGGMGPAMHSLVCQGVQESHLSCRSSRKPVRGPQQCTGRTGVLRSPLRLPAREASLEIWSCTLGWYREQREEQDGRRNLGKDGGEVISPKEIQVVLNYQGGVMPAILPFTVELSRP